MLHKTKNSPKPLKKSKTSSKKSTSNVKQCRYRQEEDMRPISFISTFK